MNIYLNRRNMKSSEEVFQVSTRLSLGSRYGREEVSKRGYLVPVVNFINSTPTRMARSAIVITVRASSGMPDFSL